jgi:hypothetical protein
LDGLPGQVGSKGDRGPIGPPGIPGTAGQPGRDGQKGIQHTESYISGFVFAYLILYIQCSYCVHNFTGFIKDTLYLH